MLLLVPGDPLQPRRPDPHFAPEATAAREAGHDVAIVDHDALERGHVDEAVQRVRAGQLAVYRGWMLTAAEYAAFAGAVADRGSTLRTSPEAYRTGHELPGWWAALGELTPFACWTDGPDLAEYRACLATLGTGAAVLRDFTKSAKHDWDTACYIPDVTDVVHADRVARRFLELRDDRSPAASCCARSRR